jgi:3'-phosphoadenosine 5'-phosphosulfate (PAPS) 3'-phosphatase
MSHYIIKSQFWHDRVNVLKKRGISPLTAIDIGANVGEWYKDFKQHFPHANVLSVEANPQFEAELKSVNPNSLITLMGRENNDMGVEFYINQPLFPAPPSFYLEVKSIYEPQSVHKYS